MGTIGDDGVLRLLTFNEGARGARGGARVGTAVVRPGDANRGNRDKPGACVMSMVRTSERATCRVLLAV